MNKEIKQSSSAKASKHKKAMRWLRERSIRAIEQNEPLFGQIEAAPNGTKGMGDAPTAKATTRHRKAA